MYKIFLAFLQVLHSQYVGNQPPGYCASYLNRYTSENQCVYSFVVPKKESNQCPGLNANIQDLQSKFTEMEEKMTSINSIVQLMQNNKESWLKIGSLEGKINELDSTKISLSRENNRLIEEKQQVEAKLQEIEQKLINYEIQIDRCKGFGENLQLLEQVYQELESLGKENEDLKTENEKLKAAKNCTEVNKALERV